MSKNKTSFDQMSYKNKEKILAYILLSPVLIVYIIFIFYPVINGMINAFTDFSIYNNNPKFIFLDNFKELFASKDFFVILVRTIVFVIITVAIQYVLGLAFALLLSLELPYTAWLRNFAMLPWVLPMTAAVLSFNWIFQADYGLLNILGKILVWGYNSCISCCYSNTCLEKCSFLRNSFICRLKRNT